MIRLLAIATLLVASFAAQSNAQTLGRILRLNSTERAALETKLDIVRYSWDSTNNTYWLGVGTGTGTTWTQITSSGLEVDNDAGLRALPATTLGQAVTVKGHLVAGDGGEGLFVDVGTGGTDDGGATIVSTAGRTYELSRADFLTPEHYGVVYTNTPGIPAGQPGGPTGAEAALDQSALVQSYFDALATNKWAGKAGDRDSKKFVTCDNELSLNQNALLTLNDMVIFHRTGSDLTAVSVFQDGDANQRTQAKPLVVNVRHGYISTANASWIGKDYAQTWERGVVNGGGEEVHETLEAETHVGVRLEGIKKAWVQIDAIGFCNNIQLGHRTVAPNNHCVGNTIEIKSSDVSKFHFVAIARNAADTWCNQNRLETSAMTRNASTAGQSYYGVSLVHAGDATAGSVSQLDIKSGGAEGTVDPGDEGVQIFFHAGTDCIAHTRTDLTSYHSMVAYNHLSRADNARRNIVHSHAERGLVKNNGYANFVVHAGDKIQEGQVADFSDLADYDRTFLSEGTGGNLGGVPRISIRGMRFTTSLDVHTSSAGTFFDSPESLTIGANNRAMIEVFPNTQASREGILELDLHRTAASTDARIVIELQDAAGNVIGAAGTDGLPTVTSTDSALSFTSNLWLAGGNLSTPKLRLGFHPEVHRAILGFHGNGIKGWRAIWLNSQGYFGIDPNETARVDGVPIRGEFHNPQLVLSGEGGTTQLTLNSESTAPQPATRDFVAADTTLAPGSFVTVNGGNSSERAWELLTYAGSTGTDLAAEVPTNVGDQFTDDAGNVWAFRSAVAKGDWDTPLANFSPISGVPDWAATTSYTPKQLVVHEGVLWRAGDPNGDGSAFTSGATFDAIQTHFRAVGSVEAVQTITADTTFDRAPRFIVADSSGGPITITLQTDTEPSNRIMVFHRQASATNTVTVTGTPNAAMSFEHADGRAAVAGSWVSSEPGWTEFARNGGPGFRFNVRSSKPDPLWQTITDATTTLTAGDYQIETLTGPLAPTLTLAAGEKIRIWDSRGLAASPNALTLLPPGTVLRYKNPTTGVDFDAADPAGLVMNDPSVFNDVEMVTNADGSYSVDFDPQTAAGGGITPVRVSANIATQNINLPAATGSGEILAYTIVDKTFAITASPIAGESVNGVVDGVFTLSNYGVGTTVFAIDRSAGQWDIYPIGASESEALETLLLEVDGVTTGNAYTGMPIAWDALETAGYKYVRVVLNGINSGMPIQARVYPTADWGVNPYLTFHGDGTDTARIRNIGGVGNTGFFYEETGAGFSTVNVKIYGVKDPSQVVLAGMVTPEALSRIQVVTDSNNMVADGPGFRPSATTTQYVKGNSIVSTNDGKFTVKANKEYRLSAKLPANGQATWIGYWYNYTDGVEIGARISGADSGADRGSYSVLFSSPATDVEIGFVLTTAVNLLNITSAGKGMLMVEELPTSTVVNPDALDVTDLHRFTLTKTTGQATTPTTYPAQEILTWDTASVDTAGGVTGNTYVIPAGGDGTWKFKVAAETDQAGTMDGNSTIQITVNGAEVSRSGFATAGDNVGGAGSNDINYGNVDVEVDVVAGDIIAAHVSMLQGIGITPTTTTTFFQGRQVSTKSVTALNPAFTEATSLDTYMYRLTSAAANVGPHIVSSYLPIADSSFTAEATNSGSAVSLNGSDTITVNKAGRWKFTMFASDNSGDWESADIEIDGVKVGSKISAMNSTGTLAGSVGVAIFTVASSSTIKALVRDQFDTLLSESTSTPGTWWTLEQLPTTETVTPGVVPLTLSTFTPTISGSTTIGTGTGQVFPEQFLVETKTASGITKVEIDGRFSHWDEDDQVTMTLPPGTLTTLFSAVATRESNGHTVPININVVDANTFTIDRDNSVGATSGVSVQIVGTK